MQKQPSGVYDQDTLLGEREARFKPDDLFLRNTLPGAASAEGSPDYVEPPDEGASRAQGSGKLCMAMWCTGCRGRGACDALPLRTASWVSGHMAGVVLCTRPGALVQRQPGARAPPATGRHMGQRARARQPAPSAQLSSLCGADDEDPDADVQLLPEPVHDVDDMPDPQSVRERFLASKKLSRDLSPLRPIGGEGLHEKD